MAAIVLDQSYASSCGAIAYGTTGEGPDVVLIHGTPSSSVIWGGVAARLADRYRLHLLDLPGFGGSARYPGQDVRLRSLARVLAEWLGAIGLTRPILVGHDFGAATVLGAHLVEGAPARAICVSDGVVLSPWGTPFSRHVKENERVFAAVPGYIHEAMLRAHLLTGMSRSPEDALMQALVEPWTGEVGQPAYYRVIGQFDYEYTDWLEELYPSLGVPTMILWGEDDRWVDVGEGRRLHSLIPGAELRVLPESGHFAMLDSPGLFSRLLGDWLGGLP